MRAILWEGDAKGGKRRIVGLTPAAVAEMASLRKWTDIMFRPQRRGNIDPSLPLGYRSSDAGARGQIRSAWTTACRRAGLSGESVPAKRLDRRNEKIEFTPKHSHTCCGTPGRPGTTRLTKTFCC
jgi:hypothetical protein